MANSYRLIDVLKRSSENPGFYVPSEDERKSLCQGDFAKLLFDDKERLWVKVTEVLGRGRYEGELWSNPVSVPLRHGDKIRFEARHIADTQVYN